MFKKDEKRPLGWTKEEDTTLTYLSKGRTNDELSLLLNRTSGAIKQRKYKLGLVVPVKVKVITPTLNGCKCWSKEEYKKLIELYQSHSLAELSIIFKRTYGSIKARKGTLCLTSPRLPNWTKEEVKILKTMYLQNKSMGNIETKVDRTYSALQNRLHKLKIKRRKNDSSN